MSAKAVLERAVTRTLSDEDGGEVRLELLPGLSEAEIRTFAATLPCPVPPDIIDLLRYARGFDGGAAETVDFTGESVGFEMPEVFPHGVPVAHDGFGNYWVVDLHAQSLEWGPVYFACHDAPVVLRQSDNLEQFLVELIKCNEPPFKSLVNDVHEDQLFEVWRRNPGVKTHAECLASSDDVLRGFAETLNGSFLIVDLRYAKVGMGFSWGRFGPKTEVRRCGALPVFAYAKPPSLISRLLGRRAGQQ